MSFLEKEIQMPVYHPAALLRNPSLKRDTWEDFKQIVLKYRELVNQNHYSAYLIRPNDTCQRD